MTLRIKTLVIIGLTLAGMTAVVYAVVSPRLLSSYVALEDREARSQLSRAVDALRSEFSTLEGRAADTAEWDDTYAFAQDGNAAYVNSVLVDNTFRFSRLNLITILNTSGHAVFEGAYDLSRNSRARVPPGLHQHLVPGAPLVHEAPEPRGVSGLVVLPDGPMLIVSRPILDSNSQGPSRGRFIMGRFLTASETERLAAVTHLSIRIKQVGDPDLPGDIVAQLTSAAAPAPTAVQIGAADRVDAYQMMRDIYGKPALIVEVLLPRDIYRHGLTSVRYLLTSLIGAGFLFGIVTLFLLEKFVLSRLARLSAGVARIGESADPSTRLVMPGGDEVASLAAAINQMLAALERSHAMLQEREERFQVVARATNDAVWDRDLQTGRLWCNENMKALLGYAPDEVGQDITWWHEHLHPDDRGRVVSSVNAVIGGPGQKWASEYRFRRSDGSYAYVFDRGYVIRDQVGKPVRMIGAMGDMSVRRRAEEALRQLAAIVEWSDDGIIGVSPDGHVTAWNPGAERLYGYSAADIMGESLTVLAPPERRDELPMILQTVGKGEHVRHLETKRLRSDGRLIDVSLTVSPVRDAEGRIVGSSMIARDITERKHLEDQLRQSQKMEAVGGLAGGIAHDFNNLLTAILGYSELVLGRLAADDPARADIGEISKAAERAAALTSQLLAFSRRQTLRPEVLDLNALLADMSPMLGRVIGEDITLLTSLQPEAFRATADPGQMTQVIMNLVVNARDAMPGGGVLTLETASVLLPDVSGREDPPLPPGRYLRLTVTDTGMGMDAETRQRAFEPFYTTKEQGKGTGLGLSTVYGIVQQSGGFVSIDSEPGCGTTFRIYLPEAVQKPELPVQVTLDAVGGGTETILLVEDEDMVRDLARRVLQHHGYRVIDAGHPHVAQQLFNRHRAEIDLLLTDVTMPGMSGIDLAEAVTAASPHIKVLYMSGYADAQGTSDDDPFASSVGFLQKPFTPDELAHKVRAALANSEELNVKR